MSLAVLGDIVVAAGEDLTDENSYINKRFISAAKEKLIRVLNSETGAGAVLDTFGWSRYAASNNSSDVKARTIRETLALTG